MISILAFLGFVGVCESDRLLASDLLVVLEG